MKKIFMMLLVLFIIYLGIQLGFKFFGGGHEYEYSIINGENHFRIKEKFINNKKNEIDSYYFEVNIGDTLFSYQTYASFNKDSRIIEDIIYYSDSEYKCILPIFKGKKIISDMMCLNSDIIYYYHDIKGKNANLDLFTSTLKEYGYDVNKWIDTVASSNISDLDFYKDNAVDNHFLALSTYKGVYTVNDINSYKPIETNLFNNDVYKSTISIVFKNYYIIADYNAKYRFDKFYVVDLTSNKITELNCGREISFDSYIQGTNNNSIYLFDRDNKKQYEINLKTNTVLEVGNENTDVKIYRNNDWEKVTVLNAKNNIILFDSIYKSDIESSEYSKIDKVGGIDTGYYYFYKKSGSEYLVYRAPIVNNSQQTYLFKTTDVNRINYFEDYVYYVYNDQIMYFNDATGARALIKDKELSFNENIIFGVYVK